MCLRWVLFQLLPIMQHVRLCVTCCAIYFLMIVRLFLLHLIIIIIIIIIKSKILSSGRCLGLGCNTILSPVCFLCDNRHNNTHDIRNNLHYYQNPMMFYKFYAIFRPLKAFQLFNWGQVTPICVGDLTITGSENGLSSGRRQAII